MSRGLVDPDTAEHVMGEVCELGDLQPNHTTLTLLAEMRFRFEQLLGA